MATKLQIRGGTASQWTAANPILAEREMGLEVDTLKVKYGNGVDTWSVLSYALGAPSTPQFRGAYDASTNTYPAAGTGSGTAGAIMAGDYWYMSVSNTSGLDGDIWPVRTLMTSLINTPGQVATNWRLH